MTTRRWSLVVGVLSLALVVTSVGWVLAAREGKGLPVGCYTIDGQLLTFRPDHGSATRAARYLVEEDRERIVLGYFEEVDDDPHTSEALAATVTYVLTMPLGDRPVVDTSGDELPAC